MPRPLRLLLASALLGWSALAGAAGESALVMLVDASIEMPQARIEGDKVLDGIQWHLAAELARRLQQPVVLRAVPRRRLAQLLETGQAADLACNYMPRWLEGPLLWSRPTFERSDVLVTPRALPAPTRLQDLAGARIGTVAGYAYPELEAQLGTGLVRDDAQHVQGNLRKLAMGRVDHAVVGRETLDYLIKVRAFTTELHPPLVVSRMQTSCALSPRSRLSLPDLDAALAALAQDGSLQKLFARFR